MLVNKQGREVHVGEIKNQRMREAVLRELREVPPPFKGTARCSASRSVRVSAICANVWKPRALLDDWMFACARDALVLDPGGQNDGFSYFAIVGRQYRFSTALHSGVCKVLEVDKTATYLPIRIQFNSPEGHRRIIRVAPDDILEWKEIT